MVLTFAQYNLLTSTRQCVTYNQLLAETNFDRVLVSYYIAGFISSGLLTMGECADDICYKMTESGITYLEEYERANPALVIKKGTDFQ